MPYIELTSPGDTMWLAAIIFSHEYYANYAARNIDFILLQHWLDFIQHMWMDLGDCWSHPIAWWCDLYGRYSPIYVSLSIGCLKRSCRTNQRSWSCCTIPNKHGRREDCGCWLQQNDVKMTSLNWPACGHVCWGRSASQSTASNASDILIGRKKSREYLI